MPASLWPQPACRRWGPGSPLSLCQQWGGFLTCPTALPQSSGRRERPDCGCPPLPGRSCFGCQLGCVRRRRAKEAPHVLSLGPQGRLLCFFSHLSGPPMVTRLFAARNRENGEGTSTHRPRSGNLTVLQASSVTPGLRANLTQTGSRLPLPP